MKLAYTGHRIYDRGDSISFWFNNDDNTHSMWVGYEKYNDVYEIIEVYPNINSRFFKSHFTPQALSLMLLTKDFSTILWSTA